MVAIVAGQDTGLFHGSLAPRLGAGQSAQTVGQAGEGVFVNVAHGNLVLQRRDELLIGRGVDADVLRTYNSQAKLTDDNGDAWWLGGYRLLRNLTGTVNTAGSTIERVSAYGSVQAFTYANGRYSSTQGDGAHDSLSWDGSAWTWTDGSTRVQERYAADGAVYRLNQVKDPAGNAIAYRFNNGLLTSATLANGDKVDYVYTGRNLSQEKITRVDGTAVSRTHYQYDSANRLSEVRIDLSPDDNSIADGKVYTVKYTYDGASQRLAGLTQTDGSTLSFTYQEVSAGDFRIASVTDGLGQVTRFAYDTAQRITTVTDPLGYVTRYTCDAQGRFTQIDGPQVDGRSQSLRYSYDADGNLSQTTDALGNRVTYTYDAHGNQLSQQDSAGVRIDRRYDSFNQLIAETTYRQVDPDGAGAAQASGAQTTRYVYDDKQNLRFVLTPTGRVTEYRYDGFGQRSSQLAYSQALYDVSALGIDATPTLAQLSSWATAHTNEQVSREDYAYDGRGGLQTTTRFGSVNAQGVGIATDATMTRHTYDLSGRVLTQLDVATGRQQTHGYDGLGRLLSTVDSATPAQTVTRQYDDAGKKLTLTQVNGRIDTQSYDSAGQLIGVIQAGLAPISYRYDAHGNRIAEIDGDGKVTRKVYDGNQRLRYTVSPLGVVTEQRYDALGRASQTVVYASPISLADTASLLGPLTPTTFATRLTPSGDDRSSWQFYDQAGRLTKKVDAEGYVTSLNYDGAGRLLSETRHATPTATALQATLTAEAVIVVADAAKDRTTRYFYDADGKQTGVVDAAGFLTVHDYDSAGRLVHTARHATPLDYAAQIKASGAKGYWPLNDADGTARNAIAGGPTGQYPTAGSTANGLAGHSVQLNGVDQAVKIENQPRLMGDGSIELWFQPTGKQTYQYFFNGLAGWQFGTEAQRGLAIHDNNEIAYRDWVTTDVATALRTGVIAEPNQWYHAVVTHKAGVVEVYINGELKLSATPAQSANASSTLFFGGLVWQAGQNRALNGKVAQAAIYDVPLSAASIARHHALGRATLPADAQPFSLVALSPAATPQDQHSWRVYDSQDRLVGSIDAEGYLTEVRYDAAGRKIAETRYATVANTPPTVGGVRPTLAALRPAANAEDRSTLYTYTARGEIETETAADGTLTRYTYNAAGQLLRKTTAANDASEQRSLLTDYDNLGRVTRELSAQGVLLTEQDTPAAQAERQRLGYPAALASLSPAQKTALQAAHATTYAYDHAGRRISSTDARGNTTRYYYDAAGQLRYTVNALGEVRQLDYTAFGEVSRTTVYTQRLGNLTGLNGGLLTDAVKQTLTALANANDDKTSSTHYTLRGLVKEALDSLGKSTRTTYTAFGEIDTRSASIDAHRQVQSRFQYDARGKLIQTTEDVGGLHVITATEYDAFGRATALTDANGHTTRTEYDRLGRTVVVTDPLNAKRTTAYDAFDRVLKQTDALEHTTTTEYDTANRRITVTTADGVKTSSERNRHGEVVKLTDGNGNTTTYQYNADGKLQSSTDALGNTSRKAYDSVGNVISTTDANGTVTQYQYDAANRQLQKQIDPTGLNLTSRVTLDGQGRTVTSTDANGVITRNHFDRKGQLTAVVVDEGGLKLRTEYVYDDQGRTLTLIEGAGTPAAKTTQYEYDRLGRRISETVDPAGLKLTTRFDYDAKGNVIAKTDASGNKTRFAYDALGRKVGQVNAAGIATGYVYDSVGNLVNTTTYATPLKPKEGSVDILAQGDFNGDGIQDLYVNSQTLAGLQHILYGTRHGNFRDHVMAPLHSSWAGYQVLAKGDFNGDGRTDLYLNATDLGGNNRQHIWYGKADGGFEDVGIDPLSKAWANYSIQATGDFNGDGKTDLYLNIENLGGGSTQHIWYGKTGTGFTDSALPALHSSWASYKVHTSGDFNGDGRTDLYLNTGNLGGNGTQHVWYGKADGGFQDVAIAPLHSSWLRYKVRATGDFNGDGKTDVYLNIDNLGGQGTQHIWYGKADSGFTDSAYDPLHHTWGRYDVLATGDFNGDGKSDIYLNVPDLDKGNATQHVWYGQNAPGFNDLGIAPLPLDYGPYLILASGNFDGTANQQEILLGQRDPLAEGAKLRLWRGNGMVGFLDSAVGLSPSWDSYTQLLATVTPAQNQRTEYTYDALGRKLTEIVDPNGLKLTTSFTYDAAGNVITKIDANGNETRFAYDAANRKVGQMDAKDVATAYSYDGTGKLISTTTFETTFANFDAPTFWGGGGALGSADEEIQVHGDFNGDGLPDLFVTRKSLTGVQTIRYGTADGGFRNEQLGASDKNWTGYRILASGDFNGDGKTDLYLDRVDGKTKEDSQHIWCGQERGGFNDVRLKKTGAEYEQASHYPVIASGDFDGDGSTDLVLSKRGYFHFVRGMNTTEDTFYSIYPDRLGGFRASNFKVLASGDFNGDGRTDLYLSFDDSLDALDYRSRGTGFTALYYGLAASDPEAIKGFSLSEPAVLKNTELLGSGDFNGDGKTDLFVDAPGFGEGIWYGGYTGEGEQTLATPHWPTNFRPKPNPPTVNNSGGAVSAGLPPVSSTPPATPTRVWRGKGMSGFYEAPGSSLSAKWSQYLSILPTLSPEESRRTEYAYDAAGRLIKEIVDPAGLKVTTGQRYDAKGNVITKTDANGKATRFAYDAAGRQRFSVDAAGYVQEQRFDTSGQIIATARYDKPLTLTGDLTEAIVLAALAAAGSTPMVTAYTYDAAGRRLTEVTDAAGLKLTTTFTYDTLGNVTSKQDANRGITQFTYDALGRQRFSVDAEGYVQEQRYNAAGQLASKGSYDQKISLSGLVSDASIVAALTAAGAGSAPTKITEYTYDVTGRKLSETTAEIAIRVDLPTTAETQRVKLVTRFEYDQLGNLKKRTEAAGIKGKERISEFAYDALGRQTKLKQASFKTLSGASGQLTSDWIYNRDSLSFYNGFSTFSPTSQTYYDSFGNAVAYQDVGGNWLYKAYDPLGHVRFESDAEGYVSEFQYDAVGNRTALIRYATKFTFAQQRKTGYSQLDFIKLVETKRSPADRAMLYQYDHAGRVTQVTEPTAYQLDRIGDKAAGTEAGKITRNQYNAQGLLVKQSVLLAQVGSTEQWADTTYYYDATGRKLGQVDAEGYVTRLAYFPSGKISREVQYAKALVAGSWNESSDLAALAATLDGQVDAGNGETRSTRYEYDKLGNRTAEVKEHQLDLGANLFDAADDTRIEVATRSRYDAFGNVIETTDARGNRVFNYYDVLGRMTHQAKATQRVGNTDHYTVTQFERDAHGNAVRTTRFATTVTLAKEATRPDSLTLPAASPMYDRVEQRAFDGAGHETAYRVDLDTHDKVVGNQIIKKTFYDKFGRTSMEWQGVRDAARGEEASQNNQVSVFTYDRNGNQIATDERFAAQQVNTGKPAEDEYDGTTRTKRTQANYNAFGEVTERRIDGFVNGKYEYDNAGRIWRKYESGVWSGHFYNRMGWEVAQVHSPLEGMINKDTGKGSTPITGKSSAAALVQEAVLTVGTNGGYQLKYLTDYDHYRTTHSSYDKLGRLVSKEGPAIRSYLDRPDTLLSAGLPEGGQIASQTALTGEIKNDVTEEGHNAKLGPWKIYSPNINVNWAPINTPGQYSAIQVEVSAIMKFGNRATITKVTNGISPNATSANVSFAFENKKSQAEIDRIDCITIYGVKPDGSKVTLRHTGDGDITVLPVPKPADGSNTWLRMVDNAGQVTHVISPPITTLSVTDLGLSDGGTLTVQQINLLHGDSLTADTRDETLAERATSRQDYLLTFRQGQYKLTPVNGDSRFVSHSRSVTTSEFDRWNNRIGTTLSSVGEAARPGGNQAMTTRWQYNGQNQALAETGPTVNQVSAGGTTRSALTKRFAYSLHGDLLGNKDGNGNLTRQQFDQFGRLTATRYGASATDASAGLAGDENEYDTLGRLSLTKSTVGEKPLTTRLRYNRLDQLTSMERETQVNKILIGTRNQISPAWGESAQPNVEWETHTQFNAFHYDAAGNRVLVERYAGGAFNKQQTWYRYNTLGKVTESEVLEHRNGEISQGLRQTTRYDVLGNKLGETSAWGTREAPGLTERKTWQYDIETGRLIGHTDLGGHEYSNYRYDGTGAQLGYDFTYQEKVGSTSAMPGFVYAVPDSDATAAASSETPTTSSDNLVRKKRGLIKDIGRATGVIPNAILGGGSGGGDTLLPFVDRVTTTIHTVRRNNTYDAAGRLTEQRDTEDTIQTIWTDTIGNEPAKETSNTKQVFLDRNLGTQRQRYDRLGRLSFESMDRGDKGRWSQASEYDEAGRVHGVYAEGVGTQYGYDGNNNRIVVTGTHGDNHAKTESWYSYDFMNRVTLSQGERINGEVSNRNKGEYITYLGSTQQRSSVSRYRAEGNTTTDKFYYDGLGQVTVVAQRDSAPNARMVVLQSRREYDYLGRTFIEEVRKPDGSFEQRRHNSYDASSRLIKQESYLKEGTWSTPPRPQPPTPSNPENREVPAEARYPTNVVTAAFTEPFVSQYIPGEVGMIVSYSYEGSRLKGTLLEHKGFDELYLDGDGTIKTRLKDPYSDSTTYTYKGFESWREVEQERNNSRHGQNSTTTTLDYLGNTLAVTDPFASSEHHKQRNLLTDLNGRLLEKAGGNSTVHYAYVGGNTVASSGGMGEEANVDFASEVRSSTHAPVAQSTYTVNVGDTLRKVAFAVWGDSSLWYLIANENGLTATADALLSQGTALRIPNAVSAANNADTFTPYNPSRLVGDTTPGLPPPPKGKCGGLAQVIGIAVTVMVTMATGNPAIGATAGDMARQYSYAAFNNQLDYGDLLLRGLPFGIIGGAILGGDLRRPPGFTKDYEYDYMSTATAAAAAAIGKYIVADHVAWAGVAAPSVQGAAMYATSYGLNRLQGNDPTFRWRDMAGAALGNDLAVGVAGHLPTANGFAGQFVNKMVIGASYRAVQIAINGQGKMEFANIAASAFGEILGNSIAANGRERVGAQDRALRDLDKQSYNVAMRLAAATGKDINDPAVAQQLAMFGRSATNPDLSPAERLADADKFYQFAGATEEQVKDLHGISKPFFGRKDAVVEIGPMTIVGEGQISGSGYNTAENNGTSFFGKDVSRFLNKTGGLATEIGQQIENKPYLKWGLEAIDVLAGPVAYAGRKALAASPVGDWLQARQMDAVNWVGNNSYNPSGEAAYGQTTGVGGLTLASIGVMGTTGAMKNVRAVAGIGPSRPGGYVTHDIDSHGILSPQINRASGFTNTKADNYVQSHHPIQDKWAQENIVGYDRNAAPAILLESSSGSPHAKISAAQRSLRREMKTNEMNPWGNTINQEFNIGYKQMIDAGVPANQAKKAIKDSYKYFDSLGAFQ
ncbi:FG-GAP-like repeat-containing protein [Chitinimonas sp. BJB300]|uniref:FG-GAP-like repeat-containing protein n=1 Tax=Chitinimonas sp. BJB300 TaxID=1559339 RepID=UPI0013044446|nr:FG-GAP-like repeat-containing protein [Chitinimonas sp. BJB300]